MIDLDNETLTSIKDIANDEHSQQPGSSKERYCNYDVILILKAYCKLYESNRVARENK